MVLDTHAVLWYLTNPTLLSEKALEAIRRTLEEGRPIFISAVSILEVVYLVEKARLPEAALARIMDALSSRSASISCISLDIVIAMAARKIPRDSVPDMPDRIIAATALHMGLPLVTRDSQIRSSGIDTIW